VASAITRNRPPEHVHRSLLARTRRALIAALAVSLATLASPVFAAPALEVFLARHAEKVDSSRDAALAAAGLARAELLASVLRDAGIEAVHSTNFARTRDTAGPIAAHLGLEVALYDAADLAGFVAELRAEGGRHLVVGHSNTTPEAVRLLGGEPGAPIEEADEYDRLYLVTIDPEGLTRTVLLRFGRPPGG
jgi:broad specificity phosphatase PhoE